jgi:transcription elongation factor Elf1
MANCPICGGKSGFTCTETVNYHGRWERPSDRKVKTTNPPVFATCVDCGHKSFLHKLEESPNAE